MTDDKPECDPCCAGTAPYFMCRDKACICHVMKHYQAINSPVHLTHADHTANTAIRNVSRSKK